MKWLGISYFIWFTGCVLFVGCTVKIEPLEKKPVKHLRHVTPRKSKPHRTPTPEPTATPKRPLQLEPTKSPTPLIKIPTTALANQWTMTSV